MSASVIVVLCIIALLGFGFIAFLVLRHRSRFQLLNFPASKVLLLTAHPDDEVMFFAPTILSLVEKGFEVHLLCLSSGDYDGLGSVRVKELQAAGMNLGIDRTNVVVEDFDDDPRLTWDATAIANSIARMQETHNFSAIFTFDERGVSGHKNHISLFHGASQFSRSQKEKSVVYFLKTVSLGRKYSSFLDSLFLTGSQRDVYFVSSVPQYLKTLAAMQAHQSQLVWFRWLYIFFSRYMYFNSYRQGSGETRHRTLLRTDL